MPAGSWAPLLAGIVAGVANGGAAVLITRANQDSRGIGSNAVLCLSSVGSLIILYLIGAQLSRPAIVGVASIAAVTFAAMSLYRAAAAR